MSFFVLGFALINDNDNLGLQSKTVIKIEKFFLNILKYGIIVLVIISLVSFTKEIIVYFVEAFFSIYNAIKEEQEYFIFGLFFIILALLGFSMKKCSIKEFFFMIKKVYNKFLVIAICNPMFFVLYVLLKSDQTNNTNQSIASIPDVLLFLISSILFLFLEFYIQYSLFNYFRKVEIQPFLKLKLGFFGKLTAGFGAFNLAVLGLIISQPSSSDVGLGYPIFVFPIMLIASCAIFIKFIIDANFLMKQKYLVKIM